MSDSRVRSRGLARIWVKVLAVVLFGALAAGMVAAPAGLHAQQAAAPAAGRHHATLTPSQRESDEQAHPEDEELYLHAPMVRSIARKLHLSVRMADNIFLALNFLILALGIGVPLGRILPKMLRQRRQALSQNLEAARKMTADAGARLSAVEAQLAKLDEEIAAMRAGMEEDLKRDEARVKAAMAEESGRIVAGAEQEIAAAAAHARRGLRQFAADLAIDKAVQQMVLTADNDRELIAEFVRDAANHMDGGRN